MLVLYLALSLHSKGASSPSLEGRSNSRLSRLIRDCRYPGVPSADPRPRDLTCVFDWSEGCRPRRLWLAFSSRAFALSSLVSCLVRGVAWRPSVLSLAASISFFSCRAFSTFSRAAVPAGLRCFTGVADLFEALPPRADPTTMLTDLVYLAGSFLLA